MNLTDFENIRFNKGLRGYDVQEVNYFINELLKLCHKLEAENKTLKEKVATYEQQEQFIRAALVTAEQTAESIKMNAKDIAKDIQTEAEKNALKLIKKTENETKAYRDNIYKCFYSYERELRLIVDHFYTLARKHMQQLAD
ncbi:MAG: cell division initiation protein [Clostridiales bacterium]|nr:cell division initiation protein [Clostridiales bacterium]